MQTRKALRVRYHAQMKAIPVLLAVCMTIIATAATATLPAPPAANSPENVAAILRDKALHGDSTALDFVTELTTRFGPRPAGSAPELAAAQWAERKLKALGFANVRIESFPMTAWVRGTESGQIVAPGSQPLTVASLGGAPPTPAGGIEGEVVPFANLDALKAAAPGSLAGRIAMITFHMPPTQDGSGYSHAVAARGIGPIEAAKRGAIAFIIRSVATGGHRFAHAGATRFEAGRVPIPAFAVSEPDGDQIERLQRLGETVRVRLTSNASYVPNSKSYNVVGEVRGTTRANEVVVLGAHLDSWDLGTGAIDDGAGCAIITAAARLALEAPHKPRRTVRVVLYGSEEVTQPDDAPLGNRVYAETHKAEIATHIAAGESDFGAGRVYALSLPQTAAQGPFAQTALRVLAPLGIIPSSEAPDGGTDVGPLGRAGVPLFDLHQDGTLYFDYHHTADDTLDKIEPAALSQNVAAWTALTWLIIDSDVDFRAVAH
jgi:Zn-dependent M28 family amino/carboxypeptidase